jgi:hypothetical protein
MLKIIGILFISFAHFSYANCNLKLDTTTTCSFPDCPKTKKNNPYYDVAVKLCKVQKEAKKYSLDTQEYFKTFENFLNIKCGFVMKNSNGSISGKIGTHLDCIMAERSMYIQSIEMAIQEQKNKDIV